MKRLHIILLLIASLPVCSKLHATHQRAAEITFRHIEGYTYEITLVTYTFTPSPADRPQLEVLWGDGTSSVLQRTEKTNLPNQISRNVYRYDPELQATTARHTYAGAGTYKISMEDANRNYGVLNIPNSVNTPIYVESMLTINPFLGINNSPELLNPPVDDGCAGQPFFHNTGAWDPDGDSLSYKITKCRGMEGLVIPGYSYPETSGIFEIDPISGTLSWEDPVLQGEYNISILVEEWRNGIRIGYVTRDMQINIVACQHEPPLIESLDDTCVTAGELLQFPVTAIDPDGDIITLNASGGPFEVPASAASFEEVIGIGEVSGQFAWQTECAHVRRLPYQTYFKATDNGSPVNLTNTKAINIRVIAPAPEILSAEPLGQSAILKWSKSPCPNASGYKLYRKNGQSGWQHDVCENGVPDYTGFRLIHESASNTDTIFRDDNHGEGLTHGVLYCYVVTAIFPDGAEGYASNEYCVSLKKDVPVITNASIQKTDAANGSVFLAWSKPSEIDAQQAPGPYKYLIYRKQTSEDTFKLIDSTQNLNDTLYTDNKQLNTLDFSWEYRIDFYNDSPGDRFFIGSSSSATTEFLSIEPANRALRLSWAADIPWAADTFLIFRKNEGETDFSFIQKTSNRFYEDPGLINFETYCYYIESQGSYGTAGFVEPIINFSQENCAFPFDNEPPCPPELFISTLCDESANQLFWTNPNNFCSSDAWKYFIYFKQNKEEEFMLLDSTSPATDTSFLHLMFNTVTGCYAVSALDSNRNEGDLSNIICITSDSCPEFNYRLPNVFTPNDDGYNDYFRPFPFLGVERIEIEIFSRWGDVVFKTDDPEINWDGKREGSGSLCADGTYFYTCTIWEQSLNGLIERNLKGTVYLMSGQK